MKKFIYVFVIVSISVAAAQQVEQQQQRILRRVIKSTPTASNLGRVRLVTVRSASAAEKGVVSEITSKEAATFGQRSANETAATSPPQLATVPSGGLKSKGASSQQQPASVPPTTAASASTTPTTSGSSSTTATPSTTGSSTPEPSSSTAPAVGQKHRASERQQQAEVELLSVAPSSWQTMSAVEAPAAMLIATGTRAAVASSDLSSSSSSNSEEYSGSTGDFLRSNSVKGGSSFTRQQHQQQSSARQQQQSFFYPQQQQQQRAASKTSSYQAATKTNWYQPPSTTPRPAPIIQQQYEQQSEQYVEAQQEYGAAPLGQAEPFAFDFKTEDNSGNGQYRKEESDKNGVVRGSYGYTDANGIYRHVDYVADQNGFRANIKSNEPGLIGETQPASIQYAGGPAPTQANNNQRYTAPAADNGDWTGSGSSSSPVSEVALAPPDFESSHKSDRIRAPRNNFRN